MSDKPKLFGSSPLTPQHCHIGAHLFLCASRPLVISTDLISEGAENGRTCDLLDVSREPPTDFYSLEPQSVGRDDPNSEGGAVERF